MFRDSRGVVHTVSAPDPLTDVPPAAATALATALLVPVESDLGSALERCDGVIALLERWQDEFFSALPDELDPAEERRWAEAAGVNYDDLTEDLTDELPDDLADKLDDWDDEDDGQLDLGEPRFLTHADDPATAGLDEDLVNELERELLLLPMRTRLEALLGAAAVVEEWMDLLADQEKCLGHLVLAHHTHPDDVAHESLADLHASLHSGTAGHRP